MSHKYTTPPSSPRSALAYNSPKSSSGGSLPASPERPRTYYKSSPQALSSFLAARMSSQASSKSTSGLHTPSLIHSEQDSASEGSSDGDELEELLRDGRKQLFGSVKQGLDSARVDGEDQLTEGQGADESLLRSLDDDAESHSITTSPSLSRKIQHPLSPCSSCGVVPSPSTDSHISLLPCEHLLCPQCIAQLVNGVSNDPPRPGMCFHCGGQVVDFVGVKFAEKVKDEVETGVEEWRRKTLSSPGKVTWVEGVFTPPSSPGSVRSRTSIKSSIAASTAHGVVRVDNIPWDIKTSEITEWIPSTISQLPSTLVPISILCSRSDGRTLSQAYIELPTIEDAQKLVRMGQGRKLRERNVGVCLATQKELLEHIFPDWKPGFDGVDAREPWTEGNILSVEDVEGLVQLCSMESPHILKAPERVFLQLATILSHLPVHQESTWDAKLIASLVHAVEVAITTILNISEDIMQDDEAHKLIKLLLDVSVACAAMRESQKNALLALVGAEPMSSGSSSTFSPFSCPSVRSTFITPPTSPASVRSPTLSRIRHSPSSPSPLRYHTSPSASLGDLPRAPPHSPTPARRSFVPAAATEVPDMMLAKEDKDDDAEMTRLAESMGVGVDLVRAVAEGLKMVM